MPDRDPESLFEAHLQLATRIGQSFPIPGMSHSESVQEARIALWQAAKTFDPSRGSFEGFATIVIRNHLRNGYERAKRTWAEVTDLDAEKTIGGEEERITEKESIPDQEADPLLEAERADIRKAIRQSLDGLTAPQKELLERFAAGESYADIGRERGVSPAAVRQMALRALETIRPNLEARSIGVRFMPENLDEKAPGCTPLQSGSPNEQRSSSSSAVGYLLVILLLMLLGGVISLIKFLWGLIR